MRRDYPAELMHQATCTPFSIRIGHTGIANYWRRERRFSIFPPRARNSRSITLKPQLHRFMRGPLGSTILTGRPSFHSMTLWRTSALRRWSASTAQSPSHNSMDQSADSRRSVGLPTVIALLPIRFISLRSAKWNCSLEETKLRTNTFVPRLHSRAIQWSNGSSRGAYERVNPAISLPWPRSPR